MSIQGDIRLMALSGVDVKPLLLSKPLVKLLHYIMGKGTVSIGMVMSECHTTSDTARNRLRALFNAGYLQQQKVRKYATGWVMVYAYKEPEDDIHAYIAEYGCDDLQKLVLSKRMLEMWHYISTERYVSRQDITDHCSMHPKLCSKYLGMLLKGGYITRMRIKGIFIYKPEVVL